MEFPSFDGFDQIELGERGIDFIRQRLEWNRTLARFILERGDLDAGRVFTYLPEGTIEYHGEDRVHEFRWGILIDQPPIAWTGAGGIQAVPHITPLLIQVLQVWLNSSSERVVIFEEPMLSADHQRYQTWGGAPVWFYGGEVYYPLLHGDRDEKAVDSAIREATWLFGLGFLASLPLDIEILDSGEELPNRTIRLLADNTSAIVVDAYDGEGFLVCHGTRRVGESER